MMFSCEGKNMLEKKQNTAPLKERYYLKQRGAYTVSFIKDT